MSTVNGITGMATFGERRDLHASGEVGEDCTGNCSGDQNLGPAFFGHVHGNERPEHELADSNQRTMLNEPSAEGSGKDLSCAGREDDNGEGAGLKRRRLVTLVENSRWLDSGNVR
jgi:hypothetical protein